MKDRATLAGTPEMGLKNAITYQDNVDEYGHRVYEAMRKVGLNRAGRTIKPHICLLIMRLHMKTM